ncbi:hypothetical protein SRHO_G00087100 [Serrasalmus rhombeus]
MEAQACVAVARWATAGGSRGPLLTNLLFTLEPQWKNTKESSEDKMRRMGGNTGQMIHTNVFKFDADHR